LEWAAVTVSVVVLLSIGYPVPGLLLITFAIGWLLVSRLRRTNARQAPMRSTFNLPARGAGVYAIVLLASVGWSALTAPRPTDAAAPSLPMTTGSGGPDVFVVLLDGYPRSDTLLAEFAVR
jgi:hypothetical protein